MWQPTLLHHAWRAMRKHKAATNRPCLHQPAPGPDSAERLRAAFALLERAAVRKAAGRVPETRGVHAPAGLGGDGR